MEVMHRKYRALGSSPNPPYSSMALSPACLSAISLSTSSADSLKTSCPSFRNLEIKSGKVRGGGKCAQLRIFVIDEPPGKIL